MKIRTLYLVIIINVRISPKKVDIFGESSTGNPGIQKLLYNRVRKGGKIVARKIYHCFGFYKKELTFSVSSYIL